MSNLEKQAFRVVALLAGIVAAVPQDQLPASARASFAVITAVILGVDRFVSDPSTGRKV